MFKLSTKLAYASLLTVTLAVTGFMVWATLAAPVL